MPQTDLDVAWCRDHFPPIANGWAYFENAGGSYVPRSVIEAVTGFLTESKCQPGWEFDGARAGRARMDAGHRFLAEAINAGMDEVIIGPSTTLNVYVLAHALGANFGPGDEIVVTNQDHEANSGAWRRLADSAGVTVREWRIDAQTGDLDPADLEPLLGANTRLVCFPHVSNVVGSINDVAAITAMAHAHGAMVCVDGVAAVAHELPDVKALGADVYLFSLYKLYGPHLAVMYATRDVIAAAANQNHYFHANNGAEKLHPGGLNYDLVASIPGTFEYFDAVHAHHFGAEENSLRGRIERIYGLFKAQERALMGRFLDYIRGRDDIRLIGRDTDDPRLRAPTFSLVFERHAPKAVAEALLEARIAVAHGHFYGIRAVEGVGIDPATGVLRVSMTHYNTLEEVDRLIAALETLG